MKNKWRTYSIKAVELSEEKMSELFCGVYRVRLDGRLAELQELEDGCYEVVGLGQYFDVETRDMTKYGYSISRHINFPVREESVICDYLDELHRLEEIERRNNEQKEEGEIMAEITVFNNDLETTLEFVDGVAKMKNYYRKTVELRHLDKHGCVLCLDGKEDVDIYFNEVDKEYSAYDGVDGYGWHKTIKQAVKAYMKSKYYYKNSFEDEDAYHEVTCSNCGDGGCLYCEPHRFL